MCQELGSAFYSCLYRPAQCAGVGVGCLFLLLPACTVARSWGRLSIPAFTGLHNVPGVGVGFLFLPLPACTVCQELGSAFYSYLYRLYRPAQCARSWGRLSIPAFTGLHNVPACIMCQELGSAFYSCLYRPAQCARSWGRLSIPAFTGLHSVPGVVGRYSCLYRLAQCARSWGSALYSCLYRPAQCARSCW